MATSRHTEYCVIQQKTVTGALEMEWSDIIFETQSFTSSTLQVSHMLELSCQPQESR